MYFFRWYDAVESIKYKSTTKRSNSWKSVGRRLIHVLSRTLGKFAPVSADVQTRVRSLRHTRPVLSLVGRQNGYRTVRIEKLEVSKVTKMNLRKNEFTKK